MKKLCIVTPSVGKYSETFIQNHIDFLEGKKCVVTLNEGVFADEGGTYLGNHSLLNRGFRFVKRIILRETFHSQQINLLARHLVKNKVDHVLIEYGTTAKRCYEACLKARIPFTVHFHGVDAYKQSYASPEFYNEVFENAHKLVVVSEHMKDQLISLGASELKIRIIPYGTTFSTGEETEPLSAIHGNFIFAVGRFVEKKAPYLTILAFAKVLKEKPDLKLYMAGDGVLLPMCKDIVKGLNLESKVVLMGAIPHSEVSAYMKACQVFVQHSKSAQNGDSEGLPNAIIEAIATKKPVVSTYHSGIPEIIIPGHNGFLSDEGDVDGMAKNIISALTLKPNTPCEITDNLRLERSIQELNKLMS